MVNKYMEDFFEYHINYETLTEKAKQARRNKEYCKVVNEIKGDNSDRLYP
jgi:hypothetical protein